MSVFLFYFLAPAIIPVVIKSLCVRVFLNTFEIFSNSSEIFSDTFEAFSDTFALFRFIVKIAGDTPYI